MHFPIWLQLLLYVHKMLAHLLFDPHQNMFKTGHNYSV